MHPRSRFSLIFGIFLWSIALYTVSPAPAQAEDVWWAGIYGPGNERLCVSTSVPETAACKFAFYGLPNTNITCINYTLAPPTIKYCFNNTVSNFDVHGWPRTVTQPYKWTAVHFLMDSPLKARFVFRPEMPETGKEIIFNASDSSGNIVDYFWVFGDGNSTHGVDVTHTYKKVGQFTVKLTVTDNDRRTNTTEQVVSVTCKGDDECTQARVDPDSGACLKDDGRGFHDEFWNDEWQIQNSNNCYAYALNKYKPSGGGPVWPHPGKGSPSEEDLMSCPRMEQRAIDDGLQPAPCNSTCLSGGRMVALVIDPGEPSKFAPIFRWKRRPSYHWYREDIENVDLLGRPLWSHKPGGSYAIDEDALRQPIIDPQLANGDYTSRNGPNFSVFCSCFCTKPSCDENIYQ